MAEAVTIYWYRKSGWICYYSISVELRNFSRCHLFLTEMYVRYHTWFPGHRIAIADRCKTAPGQSTALPFPGPGNQNACLITVYTNRYQKKHMVMTPFNI
jgi:hypothetical protein